MARKSPMIYSVRPRYTPGSPAWVDRETAARVAREESEALRPEAEGRYGLQRGERAAVLGLARIVLTMVERAGGWDVADLLTGETYRRPHRWPVRADVDVWSDDFGWITKGAQVIRTIDDLTARVRFVSGLEGAIAGERLRLTSSVRKPAKDSG